MLPPGADQYPFRELVFFYPACKDGPAFDCAAVARKLTAVICNQNIGVDTETINERSSR
jgi:hypothetical protein